MKLQTRRKAIVRMKNPVAPGRSAVVLAPDPVPSTYSSAREGLSELLALPSCLRTNFKSNPAHRKT